MSKKKGKRMGLGQFLDGYQGEEASLPTGPSGRPSEREQRRENRSFADPGASDGDWKRGSAGGERDGPFGERRGGGGYRDEEAPMSRADADDKWRRGPPSPSRGGFGDDEGPPMSRADADDQWRRSPPSPSRGGGAGGDGPPRTIADDDGDWRSGNKISRGADKPRFVSEADSADTWRRSAPVARDSRGPPPRANPLDDNNWRGSRAPAAPPAPRDADDDGRPRLRLTSQKVPKKEGDEEADKKDDDKKVDDKKVDDKKEGGDKWERIFGARRTEEQQHRMYGSERDHERERSFEGTNNRRPLHYEPRQGSEAFGSSGRNRERDDMPPRREFPGSEAFGSSGRNRERDDMPPRREFPGSEAFGSSGRSRERDDMPRREFPGGSRSRGGERDDPDRQRAAMAFGGGRRNDRREREDDRARAAAVFGSSSRRREERDEFGGDRRRGDDYGRGPAAPQNVRAEPPSSNWGDDSEDKKSPVAQQKKSAPKLSEEELAAKTDALLKTYLLLENKREAISEIKKLHSPEYLPQVIRKTLVKGYSAEGLKELKLIVGLIKALLAENVVSIENVVEGIEQAVSKHQGRLDHEDAKERSATLKKIGELLEENEVVPVDAELGEGVLEFVFPNRKSSNVEDSGEDKSIDHELLEKIVSSKVRGEELAEMVDVASVQPDFAAVFITRLLEANPVYVCEEAGNSWCGPAEYGALLSKLVGDEEPDAEKLKAQIGVLYAVQAGFNKFEFPRASNGQSLIEKTFMKLYNDDIVAPEAIIEWKDDISDSAGKVSAIVQLSQFVNWLEADDEEDEESE